MSQPHAELTPTLRQALAHHRGGRLREAEQLYRHVLQVAPEHPDALHLLGVLAYQVGRLEPAADLIRRAVAVNPAQGEYHSNLGNVLQAQGHIDQAVAAYRQAVTLSPRAAMAHNNLGVALQARGESQAAAESFRTAIAIEPGYAEAHNNLAIALQDLGDDAAAMAACRHAIALRPDYAEAHNNLGLLLQGAGQREHALAAFQRALALKADYPDALSNLGNLLIELRRPAEAETQYRRALDIAPESAGIYNNLGKALRTMSRREEALAAYRHALALRPGYVEAQNNLGWMLQTMGRPEEAEPAHRRAIELAAGSAPGAARAGAEARHGLGNALRALGGRAAALAAYDAARAMAPASADLLVDLASVLFDDRDLAPAADALADALAARPDHLRANFLLGLLHDLKGDQAAAERCFARLPAAGGGPHCLRDSWDYAKARRGPDTRFFGVSFDLLGHALEQARVVERAAGMVLEFGVLFGTSIRFLAERHHGPIHGFDTFQGLPEAWGGNPSGAYSTQGELPQVPPWVTLHVGDFKDSLPPFLAAESGPLGLAHIDCDLYSSTRTLFELLAGRIVPGSVLVFDEYICTPRWREDEFRAFQEAVLANGWRYDYLAFNFFTRQVSVMVKSA